MEVESLLQWTVAVSHCPYIRLTMSGDVELNPGPPDGE